jgi:putative ABC transport system permease protein
VKQLVANNQVRLGPGCCLRLALSGMSYRIFRSSVTISILALAVAFLVHMLSFSILSHETQLSAYGELSRNRGLGQYITRLTTADTQAAVMLGLDQGPEERIAEYERWAEVSPATFAKVRSTARLLNEVEVFLKQLPSARQAVILGDLTAYELYDRLQDDDAFNRFAAQLGSLNLRLPSGEVTEFRAVVQQDRRQLKEVVAKIIDGHARAIDYVAKAYPGRTPEQLAADPPAGFSQTLRQAGFSFADGEAQRLAAFGQRVRDLKTIGRLILRSDTRAAIARETRLPVAEVSFEAVVDYVDDVGRAEWFSQVLRTADAEVTLSAARITELFEGYRRERRLVAAVGEEAPSERAGPFGMSERSQLLILLSLLVCVVGVANAMLMSVTERFTEIATMKCLGALDRSVTVMFVFEAVIQGAVGGLIGVLLGIGLALLRGLLNFGSLLAGASGAWGELSLSMLASWAVGVLVAAVAAVGPAWVAARLAPMEAMRVQ